MTKEDERKVAEYRKTLGKYPRPSVTADIVAVRPAYGALKEGQWRENPKFALETLLIRRGQWPYEGCWALPSGFIRPTESVEDGARRELREETSLTAGRLLPIGAFSAPGRDMRAWVISNAFLSVHRRGEGTGVKGGDDAADAKWMRVEFGELGGGRFALPFTDGGRTLFTLSGTYRPEEFGGGTVLAVKKTPLAFDHARILAQAFLRMLAYDLRNLAFLFLPEKFTLSDYIGVYEYLSHEPIKAANVPNFRRCLTQTKEPLLETCRGEYADLGGRGHAPARLYRRRGAIPQGNQDRSV